MVAPGDHVGSGTPYDAVFGPSQGWGLCRRHLVLGRSWFEGDRRLMMWSPRLQLLKPCSKVNSYHRGLAKLVNPWIPGPTPRPS